MISKIKIFLSLFLMIGMLSACSDDNDKDTTPPAGEALTNNIVAEPGERISFSGTFSSEAGFKQISIFNDELNLNKQIVFANQVKKYFLDYNFTIPQNAQSKIYEVTIIAETLGGGTDEFIVNLDVASSPAAYDLVLSFNASPGELIHLTGNIVDQQGIASIKILSAGIGLDMEIKPESQPDEYELNIEHQIPFDSESKVHKGTIVISNIKNRTIILEFSVNASGEAFVYENIYVAGSFQWWEWNPGLAYPMSQDPEDDRWFTVDLQSWNNREELKFIGQLGWNPDNWGLVNADDPSQGMMNDESSAVIQLNADENSPSYKRVRFNPYALEYTVEDLTPEIAPRSEMYIVGKGFPDYPDLNWNTNAAIPMQINPDGLGEHIFIITGLEFSDDVDMKFIGQTDGWGPYDAGFDVDDQEVTAPVTWVNITEGSGTKDLKFKDQAGTYTVMFDYYLKKAIIRKE